MIGSERFIVTAIENNMNDEIREIIYVKDKNTANQLVDNLTKEIINKITKRIKSENEILVKIKKDVNGLKSVSIRLVNNKKITERKVTVEAVNYSQMNLVK